MSQKQSEILFLVEEAEGGEFVAKAVGVSIYTQAPTLEELKKNIFEALECHFEENTLIPPIVRLHIVKDAA